MLRQNGALVSTELVNVKGRVAMVTGFIAGDGWAVQDEVQRAVRVFAEQERRDNAR